MRQYYIYNIAHHSFSERQTSNVCKKIYYKNNIFIKFHIYFENNKKRKWNHFYK